MLVAMDYPDCACEVVSFDVARDENGDRSSPRKS